MSSAKPSLAGPNLRSCGAGYSVHKPKEFDANHAQREQHVVTGMLVDLLLDKDDGKYVIARDGGSGAHLRRASQYVW